MPASCWTVVAEGNYLLLDRPEWRAVAAQLDEVAYIDVPLDVRRERLVSRHVRFGKSPAEAAAWVDRVDLPNGVAVETSRDRADRRVTPWPVVRFSMMSAPTTLQRALQGADVAHDVIGE